MSASGSDSASRARAVSRRASDLDLESGFVLDVRNLGRQPGTERAVQRTVSTTGRLGLDLIAVPVGAQVELDLRLQAVSEGVLVTGGVTAPVQGECSRCLEPLTDELDLELTELFAYPGSVTEQTTEDDEVYRMTDDLIDLEPVILDAVGLALPLQPLCTPDCAGLCPECGVRMASVGPDHAHEILDPRWAGLANFAAESPGNGSPESGAAVTDSEDRSAEPASNRTEEK